MARVRVLEVRTGDFTYYHVQTKKRWWSGWRNRGGSPSKDAAFEYAWREKARMEAPPPKVKVVKHYLR